MVGVGFIFCILYVSDSFYLCSSVSISTVHFRLQKYCSTYITICLSQFVWHKQPYLTHKLNQNRNSGFFVYILVYKAFVKSVQQFSLVLYLYRHTEGNVFKPLFCTQETLKLIFPPKYHNRFFYDHFIFSILYNIGIK